MIVDLAVAKPADENPSDMLADPPLQDREAACRQTRSRSDWSRAGIEPSLEEVLEDPIVSLLLRRDGLTSYDVRRVTDAARRRLR